jgi:DNA polymerase-3 subunit delta'
VIGNQKNVESLKDLRARGALSHGYIFHGPAMVGKKTTAREFAEFLEHGNFEAIRNEDGSERILSDFMLITPGENGSIGIDAVREIRNFLWQKPNASPRRTLVIDDAEMLTAEAQNALLKITEEPPVSSLLILVTSDIESILPTITSRLPRMFFGTVAEKEIAGWLAASGTEKKKVGETAKKAIGKPGLAWRLLHDENFTEQLALAEKLLKTPAATRRDVIKKIIEPDEFNFRKFLDAMIIVLAWQAVGAQKKNAELWHKVLTLYGRETNFSLNPRLQLESLLTTM